MYAVAAIALYYSLIILARDHRLKPALNTSISPANKISQVYVPKSTGLLKRPTPIISEKLFLMFRQINLLRSLSLHFSIRLSCGSFQNISVYNEPTNLITEGSGRERRRSIIESDTNK